MNILELCKVPLEQRDDQWEERFFKSFCESKVEILSPEPQTGPDSWPYLLVEVKDSATEPSQKILQWLSTRGIGLVVNPRSEYPDYVFSYGMIWHFRKTGYFLRRNETIQDGNMEFNTEEINSSTDPSDEYLPLEARKILKQFFMDQGILQPRFALLTFKNGLKYLTFSLNSMGSPKESEHAQLAEAISWFLPPHYLILLTTEGQGFDYFNL